MPEEFKERGRQRTDSLAVLTRVRTLNRIELVVETLRLAVGAILAAEPEWTRATVPMEWEELYGKRCVAERLSENERGVLQARTGQDGQWLLERLDAPTTPKGLSELPEVKVLRTVWAQQYEVRDRSVIFQEAGPYDGCASQTGKVVKVKVLNIQGLANQNDPKSCAWANKAVRSVGRGKSRSGIELRNTAYTPECRRGPSIRKATCGQSLCETDSNSAQSETLYMLGNTLHGNWESLRLPGGRNTPGCIGKSKDVSQ